MKYTEYVEKYIIPNSTKYKNSKTIYTRKRVIGIGSYYKESSNEPTEYPNINIIPIMRPTPSSTYIPTIYSHNPVCMKCTTNSPSFIVEQNPNTTIVYSYSFYNKQGILILGIASGISSLFFCIIFIFVYKTYSSNKYKINKLTKIHKSNTIDEILITNNNQNIQNYNSDF
jgi:hypothetical protein